MQKYQKLEEELTKTKAQLDEKNKLCLNQKHQIEDLSIETKNLEDKYNNQQNLLKFYEEQAKKEGEEEVETDPEKKDKIKKLIIGLLTNNNKNQKNPITNKSKKFEIKI